MLNMKKKIGIFEYNAIVGFVDYGRVEIKDNDFIYITKMRCKSCGAAWIAENYCYGNDTCP